MPNTAIANYFGIFSKENCDIQEYIALARRVGRELNVILGENDSIQRFEMVPVQKNDLLVWDAPSLFVGKDLILNLSSLEWDKDVMASTAYKNIEQVEKKNLIDDIQSIVNIAQSYFPTYLPRSENAKFIVNKTGFLFNLGLDDDSSIGEASL